MVVAQALDFLIDRVHESNAQQWPQVVGEAARYFKNHAVYAEYFNTNNTTVKLLGLLSAGNVKQANKLLGVQSDKKERKRFALFQPRQPAIFIRSTVAAAPIVPTMPVSLTGNIAQLATELQQEIDSLKRGCLAWLCFSKIRTKQVKLNIMQNLKNCSSLVDAKQIARNALADTCVVAGLWHSRTNDLLKAIDQYQPAAAAGLAQSSSA